MSYQLSRDITFTFQRLHTCTARKGAPVRREGGGFIIEPRHVETTSDRGPNSLWAFDTRHYFIWVREDDVESRP